MGLKGNWHATILKELGEQFSKSYMKNIPEDTGFEPHQGISVVVKDFMLWLRGHDTVKVPTSWLEIGEKFKADVIRLLEIAPTVVVGFDCNQFVTPAKAPTQRSRAEAMERQNELKGRTATPLDLPDNPPAEFFKYTSSVPDWSAVMGNRALRRHVYMFFTRYILTTLSLTPAETVIVSGIDTVPLRIFADPEKPDEYHEGRFLCGIDEMPECAHAIGEFDLAATFWLRHFRQAMPEATLLLDSRDGDQFPIMLFMEDERLAHAPEALPKGRLYIRSSKIRVGTAQYDRIMDVTLFRRILLQHMTDACPRVLFPMEHFVLALILSGTDFFNGIPGVGPEVMFSAVFSYLYTAKEEANVVEAQPTPPDGNPNDTPVFTRVRPEVFRQLVLFILTHKFSPASVRNGRLMDAAQLRTVIQSKKAWEKPGLRALLEEDGPAVTDAWCRRVTFTMNYMRNGHKYSGGVGIYHLNPLTVVAEDCILRSVWGFALPYEYIQQDVFMGKLEEIDEPLDTAINKGVARFVAQGKLKRNKIEYASSVSTEEAMWKQMASTDYPCCNEDYKTFLLKFKFRPAM